MSEPAKPAVGRNGRWVQLGEVSVDSATLAVTDPAFSPPKYPGLTGSDGPFGHVGPYGSGVQFMAGFGDGSYAVSGWVVDYGEGDEVDERVAQVVITLIDEVDLTEWRRP